MRFDSEHTRHDDYDGPERRLNGNGNGFLSGIPIWAKVVSIVGIPGTIAFYLVWMTAQTLPNILTEIVAVKAQTMHAQEMYREHMQQTAEQTRMLQKICSRLSKTELERSQCFDH